MNLVGSLGDFNSVEFSIFGGMPCFCSAKKRFYLLLSYDFLIIINQSMRKSFKFDRKSISDVVVVYHVTCVASSHMGVEEI